MSEVDTTTDTAPLAAPVAKAPRKITVAQFLDTKKVQSDLAYSVVDLSNAMMEQGSLFVHYGSIAAQASMQVDRFKLTLETAEAKVYRNLRDEATTNATKVTEAQLEKNVAVHETVLAIKIALNEAKQIESAAKTVVEAFRHRRDMLVQQGLLLREEMKGEVSISAKKAHEDAAKAQQQRVLDRLAEGTSGTAAAA